MHLMTAARIALATTRNRAIGLGFIALYLGLGPWLLESPWDLLPIAAVVVSTATFFWLDGLCMRAGMIATSLLFLVFDLFHSGSIPGAGFSAAMIGFNAVACLRHHRPDIVRLSRAILGRPAR